MRTLTPVMINAQLPYQTSDNSRACELDRVLTIYVEVKITMIDAHHLSMKSRYKNQKQKDTQIQIQLCSDEREKRYRYTLTNVKGAFFVNIDLYIISFRVLAPDINLNLVYVSVYLYLDLICVHQFISISRSIYPFVFVSFQFYICFSSINDACRSQSFWLPHKQLILSVVYKHESYHRFGKANVDLFITGVNVLVFIYAFFCNKMLNLECRNFKHILLRMYVLLVATFTLKLWLSV